MKKLFSFCLALLLIAGLIVIPASAETITPTTDWYDASKDRFELATAADFLGFFSLLSKGTANFAGKTVVLTADVDLNPEWDASTLKYGPNVLAAVSIANSFKGTFDGQGHTVSGLCAATSADTDTGIFGQAVAGADVTIRNVRFLNSLVDMSMTWRHAALMNNEGGKLTIENVYSEMIAYGRDNNNTNYTSAFTAGLNANSVTVIRDSVFAGQLLNVATGAPFIAWNAGTATLENCAFYGTANSPTRKVCSGLVDDNRGSLTIKNCISAGTVTANSNGRINAIIRNPQETVTAENNRFICDGNVATASAKVATIMTAKDLADFYNYAKDIEGFEGWDVIDGKAYPTTLAWGEKANSETVCILKTQTTDVTEGAWSVRLVGGVDNLDYDALECRLTIKNNEGKTGTVRETVNTVWTSIMAAGETVTAADLGTAYIWGVVINGIPEAQTKIEMQASVYTVKDGVKTLVSVQPILVAGGIAQ